MSVVTFTSYDNIRAAIGVSSNELKDAQLSLGIYEDLLLDEFNSISGVLAPDTETRTLSEHYSYLTALPTELTANQNLLVSYIQLFATYTIATNVLDTISMLSPKTISDGKSLMTRFSSEKTFESVRKKAFARQQDIKSKLTVLLGGTLTDKVYVSVVSPATDLVTNTTSG